MTRWLRRIFMVADDDPVYHCRVYKLAGCASVDGMLCDMKTCDIKVSATITPYTLSEITDVTNPMETQRGQV